MTSFTSPHDPIIFNHQVWDIVRNIPPGKVATYGQIARKIPPPEGMDMKAYQAFGPRWVGGAMAACSSAPGRRGAAPVTRRGRRYI